MISGIGALIVALGIIGVIYGIMQKMKAGRVADAPLVSTGDAATKGTAVAGPRGAISAQGNVICQQPVIAPMSGTPSLWYSIKVTASWKDGDSEKSKELTHDKVAAQWAIDDGSGPVWIDCREGGDFEPTQSKSETKSTGLLGGITGQDLMFGNFRVSTGMMSMGTKYQVEESCLPVQPKMYVCGKAADGGGQITPPSWRQLIMSSKSRDELLAKASEGAKMFLIGGAVASVVGIGLGVVGQFVGGGSDSTTTTASTEDTAAPETDTAPTASGAAPTVKPATLPGKGKPGIKPAGTAAATAAATGKAAATGAATAAATATPATTAKPAATGTPATPPPAATAKPATPPATPPPAKTPTKK